jgi:hypothetical protein
MYKVRDAAWCSANISLDDLAFGDQLGMLERDQYQLLSYSPADTTSQ